MMDDLNEDYDDLLKLARQEYGRAYYEEKAKELGVPVVDLAVFKPEPEAIAHVPYELALRYNVIPLRKQGKVLWLAISDPGDQAALDDIRLACRCAIKPVLADPNSIRDSLTRFYTGQT